MNEVRDAWVPEALAPARVRRSAHSTSRTRRGNFRCRCREELAASRCSVSVFPSAALRLCDSARDILHKAGSIDPALILRC